MAKKNFRFNEREVKYIAEYANNIIHHDSVGAHDFRLWLDAIGGQPETYPGIQPGRTFAAWLAKLYEIWHKLRSAMAIPTRIQEPTKATKPTNGDRSQRILDMLHVVMRDLKAVFSSMEILISDYKEQKSMLQDFRELGEAAEKVSKRIIRNGA